MERVRDLGLRSVSDVQLQEILASVSSGSPSGSGTSPGTAPSSSLYSSVGGETGSYLSSGDASSRTDDNLSLPSELLADLASPRSWHGASGATSGMGKWNSASAFPQDLLTEFVSRFLSQIYNDEAFCSTEASNTNQHHMLDWIAPFVFMTL